MNKQQSQVLLPRMSDYASRDAWKKTCWKLLLRAPHMLDRLITLSERHDVIMRAAVEQRLEMGMSYREIGRELWLSPQTISGIKKGMRELGYKSYAVRSKTERKKKKYGGTFASRHKLPAVRPRKTKYGKVRGILF